MKNSLLYSFLILLLFSCTKEDSATTLKTDLDRIPQFAMSAAKFQQSTKFLKREVSYSKNNPLLKNVRLFAYDNSNRITEIKIGTIDSSISHPVFNLKQTLSFRYDATNILPSSFSSVKSIFPNLTTTFYYKYNSQGRKVMDSVRVKNQNGEPADRVMHYEYNNDQVFVTPVLTGFPMENNALDTLSVLSGGNIEKLVSKMIRSTGNETATYTFTYDRAVSPYNKLNISNALYFEHASLGLGYNVPLETHYMGVTTNNMTSWSSGNYRVRFNYLYDRDEYPVKKEMILPGEIEPSQVTFFEY